jgi:hemin uptake protein HemP
MTETEEIRAIESPREETPRVEGDKRRVWKSEELLSGENEAVIVHHGQVYRLRCTKHGKLILYK